MPDKAFILGAGASCAALPLIDGIPKMILDNYELIKAKSKIFSSNKYFSGIDTKPQSELFIEMLRDYEVLLGKIENTRSIDTYARSLNLSGNNDLYLKTKLLLLISLSLEQISKPIDQRYESFITDVFKNSLPPNDCIVLSWNYDSQLERAYSKIMGGLDIVRAKRELKSAYKFEDNYRFLNGENDKAPFLIKLNGGTTFHNISDKGHTVFDPFSKYNNGICDDVIVDAVKNYSISRNFKEKYRPSLSFVDDQDWNENSILKIALSYLNEIKILTVVGYSFPNYNSEIDFQILSRMNNLQEINIQSKEYDNIVARIKNLTRDKKQIFSKIEYINQVDLRSFYIPWTGNKR